MFPSESSNFPSLEYKGRFAFNFFYTAVQAISVIFRLTHSTSISGISLVSLIWCGIRGANFMPSGKSIKNLSIYHKIFFKCAVYIEKVDSGKHQ